MAQDSGIYLLSYFVILYVFTRVDQQLHNYRAFPRISRPGAFRGAIRGRKIAIPHGPPASGEVQVQRDSSFLHGTKQHGAPHQTAGYGHGGGRGGGLKKKKRGQNFVRVRSGAVHHGQWRSYPPRLGSVHDETLWGGYFRGPGANAPLFRAPDVHLRLELREGGLGARRRTDKRAGAPAFGAGSSGPGDGTESRRRGRTTSECASAKVF